MVNDLEWNDEKKLLHDFSVAHIIVIAVPISAAKNVLFRNRHEFVFGILNMFVLTILYNNIFLK